MKRSKRDVAWGFFYYSTIEHRRELYSAPTKREASEVHRAEWYGTDRGPIFRITPPKTKPKRGGAVR